ncbi:MAG TPA: hypothetical protein PK499_08145, partial [Flavobacteriales bacterium]|nr:hypothetical protein [Flavobacteriales bacterium]
MQRSFEPILALLLALLPFGLLAQTQVVKGTVKDADSGLPLPGVNIVLTGSDPFLGTTTDLDGL